jgi:outer membrane protein assembly factor BamB
MRRLALAALLLAASAGTAADWARFRGPNGTGTAAGPIPEIGPKTTQWKVAVPGRGVSSPIVVGGKVFLQSATEDGKKRFLLCLDAATGKTEWTKEVAGHAAKIHKNNSFASGTPASDGKQVYCAWWDGDAMSLAAYDFAGNEKWSQSLGSYVSDHGAGHSPAVYDGTVYLNMDGGKELGGHATLIAVDAATGQRKWSVERPAHRASYSTPFVWDRPGKGKELVVGTTTEVTGYDPETGKTNWAHPIDWSGSKMKLRVVGSPVAADGLIVCYTGDGGGARYTLAIDPSAPAPKKVWDLKRDTPYVPCMLTKDGLLFWVTDNGLAGCAEAKTGKTLWQEERLGSIDITASPLLAGDEILAFSNQGRYFVFKARREFELVCKGELGEPVSASPALVDGKLYVRGASHLFCFGAK